TWSSLSWLSCNFPDAFVVGVTPACRRTPFLPRRGPTPSASPRRIGGHLRNRMPVILAGAADRLLGLAGGNAAAQAASRGDPAGSVPTGADAAARSGGARGTDHVGFGVSLGGRASAAASAVPTSVPAPGSASYRQYLTPQQFRAQFAPTQSDV